jgi:hypothetical protein
MTCRGRNVLFFTITGDKFFIYIPIRTTEVNPLENGLLHSVIWPSNTREYGVFPRGFNQSKVAIGFNPGITYQTIDIFVDAYILSVAIRLYKYCLQ